jgi:hypothetical protein
MIFGKLEKIREYILSTHMKPCCEKVEEGFVLFSLNNTILWGRQ